MFAKKVIIITGASKGIGKVLSFALASEGADLALIARGVEDLRDTQLHLSEEFPGSRVEIFPCDVSKREEVEAAVQGVALKFGRIDGVLSNAGYSYPQYFDQTPVEEFEKQIQINYLGAVYLIKATKPYLKRGSFVGLTSSVLGYMGCYGYSSYSPSKHALIGFAESIRQEFSSQGIQVSVLCPPDTETPGYQLENQTKPLETKRLSESMKTLEPEEVVSAFLKDLEKGKFLIHCNLESELIFRFKQFAPETYFKIVMAQIKKFRMLSPSGS